MITAERRGVIAGSEEARKKGNLQEHEIQQLADQVFDFMKQHGYAHIEPKSEFVAGFCQGYKYYQTVSYLHL